MRNIFTIKKELQTELEKVSADMEALTKTNEESVNTITTLETKIKDLESKATNNISVEDHNKVIGENDLLTKKVTELETKLAEEITTNKKIDEIASAKALEVIGQSGSPAVPIPPTEHPAMMTKKDPYLNPRYSITSHLPNKQ